MRKSALFFILAAAIVATGCISREDAVLKTTEGFLSSYFRADYREAVKFCTPSFAALIDTAVADYSSLPELVRDNIVSSAEKMEFRIISADNESFSDMSVVEVEISSPELASPLRKRLTLIDEGDGFLVDALD